MLSPLLLTEPENDVVGWPVPKASVKLMLLPLTVPWMKSVPKSQGELERITDCIAEIAPVDCEKLASTSTLLLDPWFDVRRIDHLPETLAGEPPPPPPPKMSPGLGMHAEREATAAIAATASTARKFRMRSISFELSVIFLARDQHSGAGLIAGSLIQLKLLEDFIFEFYRRCCYTTHVIAMRLSPGRRRGIRSRGL